MYCKNIEKYLMNINLRVGCKGVCSPVFFRLAFLILSSFVSYVVSSDQSSGYRVIFSAGNIGSGLFFHLLSSIKTSLYDKVSYKYIDNYHKYDFYYKYVHTYTSEISCKCSESTSLKVLSTWHVIMITNHKST